MDQISMNQKGSQNKASAQFYNRNKEEILTCDGGDNKIQEFGEILFCMSLIVRILLKNEGDCNYNHH